MRASRRTFLRLAATAVAVHFTGNRPALARANISRERERDHKPYYFTGADLAGWQTVLGDGIYTAEGETAVSPDDIATTHHTSYSTLQANIHQRNIMAHNITYLPILNDRAFNYIHTCSYQFRLPYQPDQTNNQHNGQTIEGGFFIWDGIETRLDYGLAFQWIINPWDEKYGHLCCWSSQNGGEWIAVGHIPPDTNWHQVVMVLDYRRRTTALIIDDQHFPSQFSQTPKSDSWDSHIAARLQAEIISLYPGVGGSQVSHEAHFRNWHWKWEPYR
ncbi:MAG: hypothetical protein D6706_05215 [Chloroflexi bacterium]|nr:MAG: hypothetical protein D6706_05215 [Chloroflexota bacterium]